MMVKVDRLLKQRGTRHLKVIKGYGVLLRLIKTLLSDSGGLQKDP